MKYNIKTDKFEKFDRKASGSAIKFNLKNALIKNKMQLLQYDFEIIRNEVFHDDFCAFTIIHNELSAKTNRYKFRTKIATVNDIPQRDAKAVIEDNHLFLSIVYQLRPAEAEAFLSDLQTTIDAIPDELNEENWNTLPTSIKQKINLFSKIKTIKNTNPTIQRITIPTYIKLYHFYINTLDVVRNNGVNFETIDQVNLIILIDPHNYDVLFERMPWIISRADDIVALSIDLNLSLNSDAISLIPPAIDDSDTIIGVIDSGYNAISPLVEWVTEKIDIREHAVHTHDSHGTSVSNIIIANDLINISDQDFLGFMKVKHFEVIEPNPFDITKIIVSFSHLYNKICEIVVANPDIKIWNLSLGSKKTPWTTGISYLGLRLDELSSQHNCIFVVAAGNTAEITNPNDESLNTPGDSVNSLTVGSVTNDFGAIHKSSYSSFGRILHNFKPEIAHFGGPTLESGNLSFVHNGNFALPDKGTSFAAPKITRLLAHYIKDGYTVKEAKAAVINDAIQVKRNSSVASVFGYISNYANNHLKQRFSLKCTILMGKKDQKIVELIVPNSIDKIMISSCYFAKPLPHLGEESSIIEMDARLVFYEPIINEKNKKHSNSISVSDSSSLKREFEIESVQRFKLQKYFPTKRKEYDWSSQQTKKGNKKVGIRLERLDLYDVENWEDVELAFVIDFYGSENGLNELINFNENIIDIDIDVEV